MGRQLQAICRGMAELGRGWAKKRWEKEWEREYEKEPRAVEMEGAKEVQPPPEGPAPKWNNNVFTNGGRGAPTEAEVRSNTMRREGGGQMKRKVSGEFEAEGASFTEYLRGHVRERVCERVCERVMRARYASAYASEARCVHVDELNLDED